METLSREQLINLVHPDPSWMNFPYSVVYEKKIITLKEALNTLYTVWDDIEDFERVSFMDYAKALTEGNIPEIPSERLEKIQEIYKNKFMDTDILVPCFICKDLKILLPEEYPKTIKTPHNVYIVEDRNHRLTALALRMLDGEEIGETAVTVFYGKLNNSIE